MNHDNRFFLAGLTTGLIVATAVEVSGGVVDWDLVVLLRRLLSWAFVVGMFVTLGRAYKNGGPVISPAVDNMIMGSTLGMSAVEWLLHGLPFEI